MFNIAKILISALIIFAASEIGKRDSLLGAIIVSLPMISLITISWIYFETKDVDKIIDFSYGVFAMIMPSLSFFITLPYFLKRINFIPSMFLSISIMVVLYFALSMLYKKIGVEFKMKTLLILFLIFASFLKGADTMKTVESVDLEKFMGKWFVIALVPNMIEKGATNSSDTYVLNKDGTIDITYDAIKDGQARQIKQKGTVVNKTSNAEWTIQMRKPFVPFMKFPFKIVYVDDNYEYMAVGYPKNTMGWIMGRTSKITDEEYKKIMTSLEKLGYTKEQFEFVQHD